MKKILLTIIYCFCFNNVTALTLDRVILGVDCNPLYLGFWPIVAKTWQELLGIKPTLAFIAPADVYIDESLGDVIRFEPIPGIKTSLQAQVIRLLLPAMFPDDVCITSDMDILPASKSFFCDQIKQVADDSFVVYRAGYYSNAENRYPMCYVAGLGSLFAEIFGVEGTKKSIQKRIQEWAALGLGWPTDELVLGRYVKRWTKSNPKRCILLDNRTIGRIRRMLGCRYDKDALYRGQYVDAHCVRPYEDYKELLDSLASEILNATAQTEKKDTSVEKT